MYILFGNLSRVGAKRDVSKSVVQFIYTSLIIYIQGRSWKQFSCVCVCGEGGRG